MSRQHTRYKEALKITYFSEYKCNTHHLIGDKIIFLIYISLIIPNLTYFSCFFSGSYVFFFFFLNCLFLTFAIFILKASRFLSVALNKSLPLITYIRSVTSLYSVSQTSFTSLSTASSSLPLSWLSPQSL